MVQTQQDWFAKWALYSPEQIAVKELETGRSLTYQQLNRQADYLASYLAQEAKLQKGDRIAILAENCLELFVLFGVAQKTGCMLVPLNYRLAGAELDYLLENANPMLALVQETFQASFSQTSYSQNEKPRWTWSELRRVIDQTPENQPAYPISAVNEDDPIFILYTSGTTGFPKGALYSHKMLFWNSINTAISLIINSESRTINVMPPFHTGGWNVLTTPFLHHGATVCLTQKFDAKSLLHQLQEERVTLFMGVPTMLKMLADEPGFTDAQFPDLHYIIVGGEPMPIPLIERWDERSVPIRQGYGMTEVGPNLTSLHQRDAIRKKGSIGRPNFYVQTRIVDAQGKEVGTNESGELWLKGPMVTPGYWKNPEATAASKAGEWFKTGDLVRCDAEGYLYVVDRIKNMFISGGENVYPAEVERVLIQHEAVAEVVVIGVPDEQWGEVGKAIVQVQAGASFELPDLKTYCQTKLAKFKIPKHLQIVESIPKNDTGKIDRKSLKTTA
ncbi:MAG: long-chain fatty acid--CoA ligase [Bacteroidota bacterium]